MSRILVVLGSIVLAFLQSHDARGETVRGQDDYLRYCSACHGEAADGRGPVANVLTPPPPALTNLTPKFGYPLGASVVAYVMGTTMPRAHGASDMPVWGKNLADEDGDDSGGVLTIWRILAYLDTLQPRDE